MEPKAPMAEASLGVARPKKIDPMTVKIRAMGRMRLGTNNIFCLSGSRSSAGTPGARSFLDITSNENIGDKEAAEEQSREYPADE